MTRRSEIYFETRDEWRKWLVAHHDGPTKEVWLVFFKKHTGRTSIPYDDAVEEALCFGWIDSIIRRIDDDRYARKFTPRTNDRKWSALNLRRVEKMRKQGKMTEAGLARIAKGVTPEVPPARLPIEMPVELEKALAKSVEARRFFRSLPPSQRKMFIAWIATAKREDTRSRRVAEAIELLELNQRLGLK